MNIHDVLKNISRDEIELILDEEEPFPDYEIEVEWDTYSWNEEGTSRLNEVCPQGVSINPFDYSDEDGNLNEGFLLKDAIRIITDVLNDEDRVGDVRITA